MFGIPFLGNGAGGLVGGAVLYGVFFVINLVIQFFTGGLSDIFPAETMTM